LPGFVIASASFRIEVTGFTIKEIIQEMKIMWLVINQVKEQEYFKERVMVRFNLSHQLKQL
jgi:hypothetical protein